MARRHRTTREKYPSRRGKIAGPSEPPEFPWERQPGETDSAWAAFVVYRDDGPGERSLAKLGRKFGKNKENFERWSSTWDWVARVRAYDVFLDRKKREKDLAEVEAMRVRHIDFAMTLQGAAALALNKIVAAERAKDEKGQPLPVILSPHEVKELAELGLKVERLNRGEPESIVEDRIVPDAEPSTPRALYDYSSLTRDELRSLRTLVEKARQEGGEHGRSR